MPSLITSSFSHATTMELRLWYPEARRLQVRLGVIRKRPKGIAKFQNLVPIPRNMRDATSSRIRVPAPTVMIMAFMINIKKKVGYDGCRRLDEVRLKTQHPTPDPFVNASHVTM